MEIQTIVLRLVLVTTKLIQATKHNDRDVDELDIYSRPVFDDVEFGEQEQERSSEEKRPCISLLRVSKELHEQAGEIFYSMNTFDLLDREFDIGALSRAGQALRSVIIHMNSAVTPTEIFRQLEQCNGLKSLQLTWQTEDL